MNGSRFLGIRLFEQIEQKFRRTRDCLKEKQAGTGPSRRHIQGSKIAKGHQSFLWDFSIPSLAQNAKKIEGGPSGENFFAKKVSQCRKKTERGDPLVSSGIVCYVGNFLVLFPGPTGEI